MTMDSIDPAQRVAVAREQLSALIDGELGDAQVTQACLQWRGDAGLRASWHAYQLIGDALRSDDLCSAPDHDAAFLVAIRSRLAAEPIVFAPQAPLDAVRPAVAASPLAGRRAWRTPVAAAAGFVAVVGVVVAMRFADAPAPRDASSLARAGAGTPARVATSADGAVPVATAAPSPPVDARGLVASGKLIRDVRLDRYLSAHKQFAGSSALGVPSGFLRNATADAADR